MKTELYNKAHVIQQETEKVKELEVNLKIKVEELETAKELLRKTNEAITEELKIYAHINNEINSTQEIMVPILRDYLKGMQEIRMAIGREVMEIIRSTRDMNVVTKLTPDIDKLCVSISMLSKVVKEHQDLPENLRKLFNLTEEHEFTHTDEVK